MSGLNVKMAGQTINDRLLAARHSIAGQGLAKSVCKATTEEMIAPKKKHLDCKYYEEIDWNIVIILSACNIQLSLHCATFAKSAMWSIIHVSIL